MQNRDSVAIIERFFLALDTLKRDRVIRGVKTFTDRFGINRRNLLTLRKETARGIFQTAWLTYLVSYYGVSADWLLTGCGNFYRGEKPQKNRNEAPKGKAPDDETL